jgi:hypothetical protein
MISRALRPLFGFFFLMLPARLPPSLSLPFAASSSSLCAPLSLSSPSLPSLASPLPAVLSSCSMLLHAPSSLAVVSWTSLVMLYQMSRSSCCTRSLRTPSTLLAAAHSACAAPADTSCTSCTLATQCDALDAASVCCCCSLDSTALAALALLSACSRSTRASQLQVHLRLELLLSAVLVAADLVAALDSATAA